ncbi:MAG: DUF5333 family protein [Pseudomonadota bacterium]
MIRPLAILCLLPAAVWAEGADTAPDYYIDGLFSVSTAEQLANFCPSIAFDLDRANATATDILGRLSEDGVTGDAILELTGVEEGVAALQAAFVDRYGLDGAGQDVVCSAARAEIAAQSLIGGILVEVAE